MNFLKISIDWFDSWKNFLIVFLLKNYFCFWILFHIHQFNSPTWSTWKKFLLYLECTSMNIPHKKKEGRFLHIYSYEWEWSYTYKMPPMPRDLPTFRCMIMYVCLMVLPWVKLPMGWVHFKTNTNPKTLKP